MYVHMPIMCMHIHICVIVAKGGTVQIKNFSEQSVHLPLKK